MLASSSHFSLLRKLGKIFSNMAGGFEKALKGYLGFLTGTGKSLSTITSYKGDLKVFRAFIEANKLTFEKMQMKDFEAFDAYMVRHGLKTNTRRRKIITARALFRYAHSRKQISLSPGKFVRAPERYEKLPWIPTADQVAEICKQFKEKDELSLRNRLIVLLLLETGMLVSELCSLRFSDIDGIKISVPGKRERELTISKNLARIIESWQTVNTGKYLLPGYNRHGVTTAKMTPRGVELLFVTFANRLKLPKLKPKTLRHYAVLHWLKNNVNETEIQRRIGVNKQYSLHAYKDYLEKQ